MDFVTSADGTRIAFEISGTGPPAVLLGGAGYGARAWAAVAGLLAPARTVYAVDRRGRGASGDAHGGYEAAREVADVQAVLALIDEPVELLGHSSGGLLALRVALSGAPVRAMTLYEPPIRVPGGPGGPPGTTERLIELLAAGDREAALTLFMVAAVGVEERLLGAVRRSAFWPNAITMAHTLPYDTRLNEESGLAGLAGLDVPTLLLLGGRSGERMRTGVETLAGTLPRCELEILPDQGHNALREAPDLLAERVLAAHHSI
ncbi:MAG TPA: alpha/beta hydrolase [Actinophytocola sp.]|uniref:alpha/beta fold hydrolase n=1 Tax=Actinophytocola sp. TaxID=1872138 RepID=UPI002DBBBBB0|nr:alpha/beta hydrolase [Actinophytocola sp.]HEU5469788.1 alpha/beta hydrolase [Actinophytocola sp.]